MQHRSIAIDGPSGAGKSTLARRLAQALGYLYVDTGAIYRTVGLAAYREQIPLEEEAVARLLPSLDIKMCYGEDGLQHMFLHGEDVTEAIRQHEVSDYTSTVSAFPAVRSFLLDMQRRLAREQDVIMDGRDIGTVVLPQADLKIFLTASPQARARRRCLELRQRGQQADEGQVLRDVLERDRRDMERESAPLRQSDDAVVVDTTQKDLEESFAVMLALIRRTLNLEEGHSHV